MVSHDFDRYADTYDDLLRHSIGKYGNDLSYYAEAKVLTIKTCLGERTPARILDFGCGIGRNLPHLSRIFPTSRVFAYDPSSASIAVARRDAPPTVSLTDNLSVFGTGFDLVLLANVLHHVHPAQRPALFHDIRGLITDDADVFIFEHNPVNPLTVHAVRTCELDRDAVLLFPSEIMRCAADYMFKPVRKHYTLFFPSRLRALSWLEPCLSWIPLGGQYMIQMKPVQH